MLMICIVGVVLRGHEPATLFPSVPTVRHHARDSLMSETGLEYGSGQEQLRTVLKTRPWDVLSPLADEV